MAGELRAGYIRVVRDIPVIKVRIKAVEEDRLYIEELVDIGAA